MNVYRHGIWIALLIGCKSHEPPAPPAPAPRPAQSPAQLIESLFGSASSDALTSSAQLAKLRELARTATPAEKPLVDKMLQFAEESARAPKDHDANNRRYLALVADLVAALGADDYKLKLKLVGSANVVWSATRYHGGFELDAPMLRLLDELVTAAPDEPVPQYLLARFMRDSELDELKGLAAAKRCLELGAKLDASLRDAVEKECRDLRDDLAAAYTEPRCAAVPAGLALFRGGPRKSEIDPTQAVVVAGHTFYRALKPLVDSNHLTAIVQTRADSLTFELDASAAHAAEDLRGGVANEDDWILVEANGTAVLAGGWDLDNGRLSILGWEGHAPELAIVCKSVERRTLPADLQAHGRE